MPPSSSAASALHCLSRLHNKDVPLVPSRLGFIPFRSRYSCLVIRRGSRSSGVTSGSTLLQATLIPHIFDPLAFPVLCRRISSTAPRSAALPAGNL